MKQPTARITKNDILAIIRRDFSRFPLNKIIRELEKYNYDERYRVWAGILKLSNGKINKLKENVKIAITDYRDIIAYSEYPEYSDKVGFDDTVSRNKINEIIKRDKIQFEKWKKGI
jgi:hypothetical protein